MGKAYQTRLVEWFLKEQRVLPWRDNPSPYRVWVSEIMLQQTQVKTVLPYFERFMGRFPTVEKLAKAKSEAVLSAWAGLGYYSRARNLHQAAKQIVKMGFPETLEGWLELPGVGRYTAGAVLSIAYEKPTAILDGNVERVLSRLLTLSRGDSDSEYRTRLWNESQKALDAALASKKSSKVRPSDFNQALMELGAMICSPKKPACSICPVRKDCSAFSKGRVQDFPAPKKKKVWKEVREEKFGIVNGDGKILMSLSGDGARWRKGLWDLPSESELSGVSLGRLEPWFVNEVKYVVTQHRVKRKIRWMKISKSVDLGGTPLRWVLPGPDQTLPLGSPAKKSMNQLIARSA